MPPKNNQQQPNTTQRHAATLANPAAVDLSPPPSLVPAATPRRSFGSDTCRQVLIELPACVVDKVDWRLKLYHANVNLTAEQSHALRSLTEALDRTGAVLANGRRVVEATDALRYLLEQVAATL